MKSGLAFFLVLVRKTGIVIECNSQLLGSASCSSFSKLFKLWHDYIRMGGMTTPKFELEIAFCNISNILLVNYENLCFEIKKEFDIYSLKL